MSLEFRRVLYRYTTFSLNTVTDQLVFFYSVIIANNKDAKITFDEFIDLIDEEPGASQYLNEWLIKELELRSQHLDEKKKMM